jgi:NAD(P)-dependent dehydrogenase (short-subunit alcohol dehydrogenase family)
VFDLNGKVALVTGAGQGVGKGIARQLASAGAIVAVNDLRVERADAVAAGLREAGADAFAIAFDVSELEQVTAGVTEVQRRAGRPLNVLVNNAGIPDVMRLATFGDEDPINWEAYFRVNAYGPMNCVYASLPAMREQRWGRVITVASAAFTGASGVPIYGASKGAGVSFMRCLALEEAANGITANAISLGLIEREGGFGQLNHDTVIAMIPVGRFGTPDEVGQACVYLASDASAYLTGQTLHFNGGMYLG